MDSIRRCPSHCSFRLVSVEVMVECGAQFRERSHLCIRLTLKLLARTCPKYQTADHIVVLPLEWQ
jgi:hypothetical protein